MDKNKSEKLRSVMFAGTGSDVGKSVIAAAFCRIFRQDGYHPAPFKAQNMALNSYVTSEGLELGRAQAVQAEAAGVSCHTDMNPLLLKPSGDCTSQVVLNGRPIGNQSAQTYFREEGRAELVKEVNAAYDRLAERYNPIVMEGAGSISELNLRKVDLVNLPMACHADAAVILVADIDRGGVFASVYGSVMLQTEEDRRRIKGILINKFRGDMNLFTDRVKMIEDLCGVPVVGVVPYYKDIYIEEEDSVMLKTKKLDAMQGKINIAVVLLRHMSNFTDFNVLERDERVHLFYTNNTDELQKADIILIPGTKNTLDDLYELRRNGVAQAVMQAHRDGATVMGICGGYQMMGMEVCDPDHVEGDIDRLPGLGLLPVTTRLTKEKVTRQVTFRMAVGNDYQDLHSLANHSSDDSGRDANNLCRGYEIHMGETSFLPEAKALPFTYIVGEEDGISNNPETTHLEASGEMLFDASKNGCFVSNRCVGTYLHGILDNAPVIDFLLQPFLEKASSKTTFNYAVFKEEQYDKLAAHIRQHVDMGLVYKIMKSSG
ncbi:MAG: cobyric acid synthase [Tannerella sp.]|jgi:adenosylcobyric acid synthase|nr:cobyric acid synthase [Tannerella sp.]